ncbi:Translation elongation factor 1 beta [Apophysomyces sp. BC1034]|nr:Translation elongation factor 1 beta [Apophysomyces sp. BC1015]KAG0179110.1 Translation elongation factor 1 beta [Apophysomyces sp. BC1021]KAG0193907.1 Translation elongation factor 1 beta [Apophysomyces sp. BC1034]
MSFTLESGLAFKILNGFFENVSYVKGAEASDEDKAVFAALPEGPNADAFPHVARWYKHIASVQGLTAKAATETAEAEDEDDIDLFGSDDEEVDEEAERVKAARVAEYNAKKAAKPKPIAKTTVTLEVKPWDDETSLDDMLAAVKSINMDGLLWGGHQFVAIGFGIKKLQINCVVEDDKVLLDDLSDKITEFEDYVQSVDIAAMQKI